MISGLFSNRIYRLKNVTETLVRGKLSNSENMNRLTISVVFISGIAFAIVISLLSGYFRTLKCEEKYEQVDRKLYKVFSPLPDESQLNVVDEGTLGLVVVNYKTTEREDDDDPENLASIAEAVASMNAAMELRHTGRHDKAQKLFEHSLALAPRHPDILAHFGEFLEDAKGDVIKADQLYRRALCISPTHPLALARSRAAAPAVNKLDRLSLRHLDSLRDALARQASSGDPPGLRRAKREAYFMHIHQSAALEGNTMTLAETRSVVETRQAVAGRSVAEHAEIVGLDAALKYVNATLAHSVGNVNLTLILEIHRRVLGFVDPLEAGRFRRTQNVYSTTMAVMLCQAQEQFKTVFKEKVKGRKVQVVGFKAGVFVGNHVPPPPKDLPGLMESFVAWLNSETAMRLHPVRHAALAHYKLVALHPFADGNGRTSRYYETLQWANEGDVRPFVRFIAECTKQTLDSYLWATEEERSGSGTLPAGGIPALSGQANKGSMVDDEEEDSMRQESRRNWWGMNKQRPNTIIIDEPGDMAWYEENNSAENGEAENGDEVKQSKKEIMEMNGNWTIKIPEVIKGG
ncbi:hypothetical protein J437_LFUL014917 [Ladona fulva]|uniref:Protein adenylyltransferase Fic n=1 Tax=Ladona fulva TaxID=123851 RepID=A0A8K0KM91_LADFU|nr:hypothetical protein J437_LFUL014917 [Ladona fulva]